MNASGNVAAWYPSDEPDLRMDATQLAIITGTIKELDGATPVLITLSNLPFNVSSGRLEYAIDTTHVDILMFDICERMFALCMLTHTESN